jgi:TetR/AcrR family transcriptional regulator
MVMDAPETETALLERKPGRPPTGNVDQRERLLDAAALSFAEGGIAATSLRALSRGTGVTPAMWNYYFGSKDRLVEAVVEERLIPVLENQKARLLDLADRDCPALIAAFVSGIHTAVARHPWLPGLWVREVLSEGGQLRSVFTDRFAAELPQPLARRFAQGQANGELNPALDPRLLFVSLIGLTMVPFAAAPIWRRVFDADDIGSADMLNHTLALLTRGIGA